MISPQERDAAIRGIIQALALDQPDWPAIEAKFNDLKQQVAAAIANLAPAQALNELFQTLMKTELPTHERRNLSELWSYTMINPDGGLEGASWRLRTHLTDSNLQPVGLASDSDIRKGMNRFLPREEDLDTIPGLDDERMWRHFDALYLLLFQIACKRLNIQPGSFTVAMDTTVFEFYGDVRTKKIDGQRYITGFSTISGLLTDDNYRSHNETSIPAKAGTTRGHFFAAMAAYHYDTKLVFPLAVRFVGKAGCPLVRAVEKFLNILKALPAPRFILADREFGNITYGQMFQAHAALTGTHYLIPVKTQGGSRHKDPMKGAQEQIGACLRPKPGEWMVGSPECPSTPEGVQWRAVKWSWKDDRPHASLAVGDARLRHWLVFFYFPKPDGKEWNFMAALDDDSYMAMFITDVEPTQANIHDLYNEYKARWAAIENTFRDEKGYFAYLPGKLPWTRFASFGSGMAVLSLKSLDKEQRMLENQDLKRTHPEFSIHQFRDRVADQVKDAIRSRAVPKTAQADCTA
jgi:hypothetical protein